MLTKASGYFYKFALVFLETILLFFVLNNVVKIPVKAQEAIGLSIEKFVDKEHVQRDKPQAGERDVTYTINIVTNGYCNAELDLTIVFDKSGSMVSHMDITKEATTSFIYELDSETDQISLVSYNSEATLDQPLTNDFQSVIDSVNNLYADGFTNIGEALSTADQELFNNSRAGTQKVILIFTDGQHNYPSEDNDEVYVIADEIKDDHDIRIISVGIGNDIDAVFLETIASSSDDYYWVADTNDLEETFINIARGLQYGSADIRVTDDLSELLRHTDFVEASDGGYLDGDILKWDFGVDICMTETKSVSFVLRVKEDTLDLTNLLNSAVVNDLGSEIKVVSNEVNTVVHAPLVEIEKVSLNEYILAGDDILYQITLRNLGSGNAYGVEVVDEMPVNYLTVYEDSISDSGYFSDGSIIWDNEGMGYILNGYFNPDDGDSALNSNYTFSYKAKVGDDVLSGEEILNTAVVYSNDRRKAIESQSFITVSSILAITGQNIYRTHIFFTILFVLFLLLSAKVFFFRSSRSKK